MKFLSYANALLFTLFVTGCASQIGKGSSKTLYSIAGVLEVNRQDLGKDIQLNLDQKLFFNMDTTQEMPGQWSLAEYDNRILLLLSDTPRVESEHWGVLLQGRFLGSGEVVLQFTPTDENLKPQTFHFSVSVRK